MSEQRLSHLDSAGQAHMVDVSPKPETLREACARGRIIMKQETLELILQGGIAKGDVFAAARLAGIGAAKQTHILIPLCHPLRLTKVEISFEPGQAAAGEGCIEISGRVRAFDRTGVEMEALTAVSVAALTIYDMTKAVDRWMRIEELGLETKSGGKSGDLTRPENPRAKARG